MNDLSERIAGLSPAKRALLEMRLKKTSPGAAGQVTIAPRAGLEPVPLSFSQQRLWFLHQLEPDSLAYNIDKALRLQGSLHIEALQKTLDTIVARHEILRTTITAIDGIPMQTVVAHRPVEMRVIDLSDKSELQHLQHFIRAEAGRPFDLTSDLMLRATLLRLGPSDHVLLLSTHHIASDGWSMGVLMQELNALYRAFVESKPSPLPDLPIQYADFAVWQRQWLQGEILDSQLHYWKQQLDHSPALLELPTDRSRSNMHSFRASHKLLKLTTELTHALKGLSRREGVTLFMTLLAAFKTVLFRYARQEDIVVGVPVANRSRPETEKLIGFFVNNLVLRTNFSGNPTFQALLAKVREVALGAYAHQDLPFEKLVEELQPERNLSHTPLFQVMFGFQTIRKSSFSLPGLLTTPVEIDSGTAKFDLFLSLVEQDDVVQGSLTYNTDLFNDDTMTRMLDHFQTVLQVVADRPELRLSELRLLTERETRQLVFEWNQTANDGVGDNCIHQLVEAQAERNPDATAVLFEGETLSYRELNIRANQLAYYLRDLGVGPDILVGVYLERSLEMVVALLGVLKAGGAYVPLDPSYPKERLGFMLEDAGIGILLTQHKLTADLPSRGIKTICLDSQREVIFRGDQENPENITDTENLAYVIYTSGSTGKPKGVQITRRSVVNFLNAMSRQPGITKDDVLVAVTTLSFDIAGLEIYLPLCIGAKVVIASARVSSDGPELAQLIEHCGATVMQATPSTWRLLVESGWRPRENFKALCGGEALPGDLASQLLDRVSSLWNMYGPTETTIWSATHSVGTAGNAIPIGRPIDNTQIYILDPDLNPVPIGVPGELYIGGVGLARGYRNRPELVAEKFIPHPLSGDQGGRLYRTGDMARFFADGTIECLGRTDHQVKLRGFRIELGEIEAMLAQHPAVQQAVVVDREITGDRRLIGYVAAAASAPSGSELKVFLRARLPEYMIPAGFVFMEKLPLTPNGKVDRRALPQPEGTGAERENGFLAPRDAIELQLANAWENTLGVKPIGIKDNFFELGGHSLLAVRLFAQIEKVFGKKLPLATLFQAPDVENFAKLLRQEGWLPSWSSLVPIQPNGSRPPFFCVHAHGGNVLNFKDLARHLGPDQPFYGLQAQGLDGSRPRHGSV
jgi:amino acid adenylation domain-containing protein